MTRYTPHPAPVKAFLYATDAETRPALFRMQHAFRGNWNRYLQICSEEANFDYQMMLAAGHYRRTVRGPLRLQGFDMGGALP
jgi:hypothetical protein